VVVCWNFLNNVCWYSDPDAAGNLYKATVERARLNAQARVLTGQQFLMDDTWTKVPPKIYRVWQLSFPMLDIRPVNLYKIDKPKGYDLFDLRVARPWGTRDVVGLFNYSDKPTTKVLDLGRLPLDEGTVHVFEYWDSEYLGTFPGDAKISRALAANEGEVFAVVPVAKDRPVLISTSRHVTQGALDLEKLSWQRDGSQWIVTGTSSHLVAGDPYVLRFAAPRHRVATVKASGPIRSIDGKELAAVEITPEKSGSAGWEIAFEPAP
jgi:hypothetical protein